MNPTDLSPLARALGSLPTGLYIVTTIATTPAGGLGPLGFVGSFVMQQGLEPPVVSVAVGREREHLAAMRSSGRFAVSILDESSSASMRPFFKKYEGGATPFDQLNVAVSAGGLTYLADALAWFECELTGEFDAGDHVVVFGRVVDGDKAREGAPSIHLRKNGLGY